MIEIDDREIAAITAHAGREYPHECGGMLIGHFTPERKVVVETFPLENAVKKRRGTTACLSCRGM